MLVRPLIVISLDCFVLEKSIPGTLTYKLWAQKQGTCSLTYGEMYFITLSNFFFFFFFFFLGGGGGGKKIII